MTFHQEIAFAVRHRSDDVARLLLSSKASPDLNMPLVAQQIEGWRQAREKWPWLAENDEVCYPPRLNREQSSSEPTARYKSVRFVRKGMRLADLTGGMGIDSLLAARMGAHVDYVEIEEALCDILRHNLQALNLPNVAVHCEDSMEWLARQASVYDVLFIDPARRNAHGGRVSAFEDCTPNLIEHLALLLNRCHQLVIKASPMIDLATARRQLSSSLSEIHVIAVKGECKEVLFVCQQAHGNDAVEIHCINIDEPRNPEQAMARTFRFTQEEESDAVPVFCQSVKQYIYEPHAALMKAGPFGLMCQKYHVEKLDRNTHLYTSADLIAEFPGRIFEVINPILLNSKLTHAAIPDGKAHVVCRNYPVDAEALQRQLKLKEGGRLFVLATTIATRKTGLLCRRVE